jgi:hypothetical protein
MVVQIDAERLDGHGLLSFPDVAVSRIPTRGAADRNGSLARLPGAGDRCGMRDDAGYSDRACRSATAPHDRALLLPDRRRKRVSLDQIVRVTEFAMTGWTGKGRIWGSGDLVHWFNLDGGRPRKARAFIVDLGRTAKPVVTPDDPEAFRAALVAAGVPVG